jgi:hypothetical protein
MIYWELAERESEDERMIRSPIQIAVDSGIADQEVSIRLPKEIAMRLLITLAPNWTELIGRVL